MNEEFSAIFERDSVKTEVQFQHRQHLPPTQPYLVRDQIEAQNLIVTFSVLPMVISNLFFSGSLHCSTISFVVQRKSMVFLSAIFAFLGCLALFFGSVRQFESDKGTFVC
jgi:hypothetical protein